MKVAILGAGISGLSLANLLKTTDFNVTVLEKNPYIGGLCYTKKSDGYVFDVSGGHIFNTTLTPVRNFVFSLLPEENWIKSPRICKILYKGNLVDYPFELAVWQLPIEEAIDCITDFLEEKTGNPQNFEEWLRFKFGASIAEKYLIPYNRKIWKRNLNQLDYEWTLGKMPIPSKEEFIASILTRDAKETKMPHHVYYYPKRGGIHSLICKMAMGVKVILGFDVHTVHKQNGKFIINNSDEYDLLVSTLPLNELADSIYSSTPVEIKRCAQDLEFNSLITKLYPSEPGDISWIYDPDPDTLTHRFVNIGNFSPFNTPPGLSSKIAEATVDGKAAIVSGESSCINFHFTRYAYPVYDINTNANIAKITDFFQKEGVILLGRFGEWLYYNMDICIGRSMDIFKQLTGSSY